MDDISGGETHPKAYVNDCSAFVPLKDVIFFVKEFHRPAWSMGNCRSKILKSKILTSTNGSSALPTIAREHGHTVAASV